MKRTHLLLAAAALAALVLAAYAALRPRAVAVEVATASRGPFETSVVEDGRTRVRDRYTVSAPLAGRIERIALRVGDPVEAGATVAWLVPGIPAFLDARVDRELRERVGGAEAQLARTRAERLRLEAQRDQAGADQARLARLAKEGFVAPSALEQADLALRTAERALEGGAFAEHAAGHDLAQARAALAMQREGAPGTRWPVRSPVKGVVLKVAQESAGTVGLGAPLVEVADARSLEAVVDVLSQDAVSVRPGMPASLELGAGVAPLAARVRLVEPAGFTKVSALGIEEQRVNVILDFEAPPERVPVLGDGFRVVARIVTRRVEDGLKVPVGTLFRDGGGWAVFAVAGGRAAKRPMRVVLRNATEALVEDGVAPGDRLVAYPPDALGDGARVTVRER